MTRDGDRSVYYAGIAPGQGFRNDSADDCLNSAEQRRQILMSQCIMNMAAIRVLNLAKVFQFMSSN